MPVMVNSGGGGDFTPAPTGLHRGVCCDVVDLGWMMTPWGRKHQIVLKWQILAQMEDGKPFIVQKWYNATICEGSNLRGDLESWRGRAFMEDEAQAFDLEKLLSAQCQLNIVHNKSKKNPEKVFANPSAIVPGVRGRPPLVVRDYIRMCERDGWVAPDLTPPEPAPSTEHPRILRWHRADTMPRNRLRSSRPKTISPSDGRPMRLHVYGRDVYGRNVLDVHFCRSGICGNSPHDPEG